MAHDSQTWLDLFAMKTAQLGRGDTWELTIHNQMEQPAQWMKYTVRAHATFHCTVCRRWWTSSQVLVLFHFTLKRSLRRGLVTMRVFNQGCKVCADGRFEEPEFTREAIEVVVNKLMKRIREKCYGEQVRVEADFSYEFYGQNEGPHETQHCEACRLGLCDRTADRNEIIYEQSNSAYAQQSTGSLYAWPYSETNAYTHTPWYTASPYPEIAAHAPPAAVNLSPWNGPGMESPPGHSTDGPSLGSRWEIQPYRENHGLGLATPPDESAGGQNIQWLILAVAVGAVLWWSFRWSTRQLRTS